MISCYLEPKENMIEVVEENEFFRLCRVLYRDPTQDELNEAVSMYFQSKEDIYETNI